MLQRQPFPPVIRLGRANDRRTKETPALFGTGPGQKESATTSSFRSCKNEIGIVEPSGLRMESQPGPLTLRLRQNQLGCHNFAHPCLCIFTPQCSLALALRLPPLPYTKTTYLSIFCCFFLSLIPQVSIPNFRGTSKSLALALA